MTEPDQTKDSAPPASPPPAFTAATLPSYAHSLFLGPDGLRPGWGLAFYLVIFYPLQAFAGGLWLGDVRVGGLWSMMLVEFGMLVAALIPSLALAKVERRHWQVYGFPATRKLPKLLSSGLAWGFAAMTLLMLGLRGFSVFAFGHLALHGVRILKFAAFWALMFVLVGLFEEFLLRGYTQFTLARGIGFWPAALVLSSAFGLIHLHNDGEQWPGLLAVAWIGLFFCFTLRRTGNLWFAVGFHAAWDWGETFVYSVPDSGLVSPGHLLKSSLHGPPWLSGGSVGPEGSVLCFLVIAVAWLAFGQTHPKVSSP